MDGIIKMLALLAINLAGLGLLLFRLMKLGNSYQQALQTAWNMIVLDIHNSMRHVKWVALLRKTWWLMLLLYYLYWVIFGGYSFIPIFFSVILHIYWFLHAKALPGKNREQVLFSHENWGIVYQEIDNNSWLAQKSLAELDLRKNNLLVLGIERDGQLLPFPKGLEKLIPGDRILLFGELNYYRTKR